MKLSQYFGKEYKILDIDLCEQINVYEILNSVEKQEIEGFFIHQSSYLELLQVDYLRGEQKSCMVFVSRKKSAALHFYDNRGFDFLCEDEKFLSLMKGRCRNYLIKDS